LSGWLAAPISSREGQPIGWIQLSEKQAGDFTSADEAVVVQLAQMTAIASANTFFSEAQEASRRKDEFLATLSHELRTPLQAILSWSQMLQARGGEDPTLRRGVEVIERNARFQARLIDELLDVSRIVTGKLVIERERVRMQSVIEAALEDARAIAAEKEVHLATDSAGDPWVLGDASRLRQVMNNLLTNAIKFTPAGGAVTVVLAVEGGDATVSVHDTGDGIPAQFLPHLFERFRQADSSTTRTQRGLGIGLAIVRHLVELHGGSVDADSAGAGRGATFVLRLPRDAGPEAASAEVAGSERPAQRLDGLRVLLVEDEADARECLAAVLRERGARVIAVDSAAQALAHLEAEGADVLISDLAMPGEDGFSLIRRVRSRLRAGGGSVPALAVSAHVGPKERARAAVAGFDLYLAKPVEPGELVAAVGSLAGKARG
jgi:signal transduction histidine kinase/ActR/RegA family two-component response regulator